jgi:hypothetical protein
MSAKMQLIVCAALLSFTACSVNGELPLAAVHQVQPLPNDSVSATRVGDHIVVHNSTKRPVAYATLDREFFQNVAASYCFGSAACGTDLPAADSASIKTTTINGVTSTSHDVIVFWWYASEVPPHQGGPPAKVRQLVIPIS